MSVGVRDGVSPAHMEDAQLIPDAMPADCVRFLQQLLTECSRLGAGAPSLLFPPRGWSAVLALRS